MIRRAILFTAALALGIAVGCTPPPVTAKPVELRSITVDQYEEEIAKHKGKVVLVDVWSLNCSPCRHKFPEFVQLHNELGSRGLVCISVDIRPEELRRKDDVLDFLKEKGADTINLIFDDSRQQLNRWFQKYNVHHTPETIVYNRRGDWVPAPETGDNESMSRFLKDLLAEK